MYGLPIINILYQSVNVYQNQQTYIGTSSPQSSWFILVFILGVAHLFGQMRSGKYLSLCYHAA
jgi:hypothetical protein